jgi:hypothetical protein
VQSALVLLAAGLLISSGRRLMDRTTVRQSSTEMPAADLAATP